MIASYTLVDKRGLEYATPIAYLEVSMIAPALLYAAWVARLRGGAVALRSELNRSSVVAGIATFSAYALVLAALQRAPAASVAAVRETSVLVAPSSRRSCCASRSLRWRFAGAAWWPPASPSWPL